MVVSAVPHLLKCLLVTLPLSGVASPSGLVASELRQDRQETGALDATAVPPESWEGVARRLATSLVDVQARAVEEPLFLPGAEVKKFGSTQAQPPSALGREFEGWRVLGVVTFEYPGSRLVADAAAALARVRQKDPKAIPELLVRAITPRSSEATAAEQTATRWVSSALRPERGDRVAVLMLWNPRDNKQPMFERMAFLLVKSGRLSDGRHRVEAVAYGTAQQAALEGF